MPITAPRSTGRPKGTTENGPRFDDRDEIKIGLYPDDAKKLDLIASVRGLDSRSEAVRYCIERAHYHIAQ